MTATALHRPAARVPVRRVPSARVPAERVPVGRPLREAPEVYVVQPGDTLWSIADAVAPDVDRRDVVAQLSDAAGGSDLVPGQRIELPRFFD